jgi:adenylate cyclase
VAGWVFVNRKPAIVNNPYEDNRFWMEVDALTGFQTRNLVCAPLIDSKDICLGTLQSLNKKDGDFTTDDLELLDLAAGMVAIAIRNSERYNEIKVTNEASRKFIKRITENVGDTFNKR